MDEALRTERGKMGLMYPAIRNRQMVNRPQPERKPFVCEVLRDGELLRISVHAATATDAWAIACDQWKYHPGSRAEGRLVMTAAEFRQLQAERAAAATATLA